MKRNLYEILEVSSGASPETIRAAYKSLLQRYHPDKHGNNPREAAVAREIIDAYQVLSDARARLAYDRQLNGAPRTSGAPGAPGAAAQAQAKAKAAPTPQAPPRPGPQAAPRPGPQAGPQAGPKPGTQAGAKPKPGSAPGSTPGPAPKPATPRGASLRRLLLWGGSLLLLVVLAGSLLLLQPGGPPPAAESKSAASADDAAPVAEAPAAAAPEAPAAEASLAAQGLRDWLLAYRSLDQTARAAEVRRLVNNGTLAVVQAQGRFYRDPRALRNAYPMLFEAPGALSLQDVAQLESLQSWWLAPRQLNLLLLNNLQPERALGGLLFELAAGSCVEANSLGAVAVDLGRRPLQPGETALVQVALPELPLELYTAQTCGTIVSSAYGGARMMPAP